MRFGEEDNRDHIYSVTSYLEHILSSYHCCHWPWTHGWGDADDLFPLENYSSHPSTLCCSEGGLSAQPTLEEREVVLYFLEGKGPHKLLGIHLHGILVYSPSLLFLNTFSLSLKCWAFQWLTTCQWLTTWFLAHVMTSTGSASGLSVSLVSQAPNRSTPGVATLLTHPTFPNRQADERALEGFAPAIKCFRLEVTQVISTRSSITTDPERRAPRQEGPLRFPLQSPAPLPRKQHPISLQFSFSWGAVKPALSPPHRPGFPSCFWALCTDQR